MYRYYNLLYILHLFILQIVKLINHSSSDKRICPFVLGYREIEGATSWLFRHLQGTSEQAALQCAEVKNKSVQSKFDEIFSKPTGRRQLPRAAPPECGSN